MSVSGLVWGVGFMGGSFVVGGVCCCCRCGRGRVRRVRRCRGGVGGWIGWGGGVFGRGLGSGWGGVVGFWCGGLRGGLG
ncbi:hypothetical protein CSW53_18090 [Rhodococcus ruber]|nr:hypothetical protein CSW53_18090 [Rhodococcus ruber]